MITTLRNVVGTVQANATNINWRLSVVSLNNLGGGISQIIVQIKPGGNFHCTVNLSGREISFISSYIFCEYNHRKKVLEKLFQNHFFFLAKWQNLICHWWELGTSFNKKKKLNSTTDNWDIMKGLDKVWN